MINGKTLVLGLIGNPVAHTLSPDIHNSLSEMLDVNEVYVPFHVEDGIKTAVDGAYRLNIRGLNVTVPYKQAVMECLSEIDTDALRIGAVNTLVRTDNGYKGYNTDMSGLRRACHSEGINLKNENIIILGAGGASRAVCYMCLSEGASRIYLLNRSIEKAESLADEMNKYFGPGRVVPLAADCYDKIPGCGYIMFQCTSLGLHEGDGLLIDDVSFYDKAKQGIDLIYNPAVTPFMKELISRNIPVFNGLKMLLYQGIEAYELWNGFKVADETTEHILTVLKKKLYGSNIVLVGYMGSGKTTIGNLLSERLSMQLLDTDAQIEENEKTTISELFATEGESYFRDLETELLSKISTENYNTVVSAGGGMVLRSENTSYMKKIGTVIYLKASAEDIYERLKDDTTRPLLQGDDREEIKTRIADMISGRKPYYEAVADITISVSGKSAEDIADEIIKIMQK